MVAKAIKFYNKVNGEAGNIFPPPSKDEEELKGLFYIMYHDHKFDELKTEERCEFFWEYFKKYRRR